MHKAMTLRAQRVAGRLVNGSGLRAADYSAAQSGLSGSVVPLRVSSSRRAPAYGR